MLKEGDVSGIAACKGKEILSVIWDISPVYEELESLANKLTAMEVSLLHFKDIIEDYIQQRAM